MAAAALHPCVGHVYADAVAITAFDPRAAAKRHTVIATNLTATQLQERYGERVSSRLLDRSVCGVVQLRGKDLRTL